MQFATVEDRCREAAEAIDQCNCLFITAGAGMGVDSGLPDFRGPEGFWKAYPQLEKRGIGFAEIANPRWFETDPRLAWGFYGYRFDVYRELPPHRGYSIVKQWADRMPLGHFVFTSNVDGHFEQAGFAPERIVECHGSLLFWQAVRPNDDYLEPARPLEFTVDEETLLAQGPLPTLLDGTPARPNALLFGDDTWIDRRTNAQMERLFDWHANLPSNAQLAVVEMGAGQAIPTVRLASQQVHTMHSGCLVRINARDAEVPLGDIGIEESALKALEMIDQFRQK